MDVMKMLKDLRAERENLDEAIATLERLAISGKKRRGRPPKWMAERKGPRPVGRPSSTQAKTA